MMRFLSLGAGVQSSTIALMAAAGEIDPVDAAIFSDTQWEPKAVYEWLEWLEKQLPYPVYRVTQGNIRENIIAQKNTSGGRMAAIPFFMINPDGSHGMGRRQCTHEYKLTPLLREQRRLLGLKKGQRVKRGEILSETFIGISLDEIHRFRDSDQPWNVNRWPLLEKRMTRSDCLAWMEKKGFPRPPKSSCLGCPFHSNAQWLEIKKDPEAWADVLEVDEAIREPVRKMKGRQFVHAERIPLRDVDLTAGEAQGDLFKMECLGMCGN